VLSNCDIGCTGASGLSDALRVDASLTELTLQNNRIADKGAAAIADSLMVNQALLSLSMGKSIGNIGASALGKMLKVRLKYDCFFFGLIHSTCFIQVNKTLTVLNLLGNRIGDDGAVSLAAALRSNRSLLQLLLTNNAIGAAGAHAIGEALAANHTSAVHTISLSNNKLGHVGALKLCEALAPAPAGRALKTLSLRSNELGDDGAKACAMMLSSNRALTSVRLHDLHIILICCFHT
jgi:hypothetical protein